MQTVKILCSCFLALLVACVHTPSREERDQADAEYKVGLALVHEAQAAATKGNTSAQDYSYREALQTLLKANRMDPGNGDVHYLLGLVYFMGFKRHAEAERHLRQALSSREDDFPETDNLLGEILVDVGRPEEALPHYNRARTNLLYKTPYFAEQGYGWALYKLSRFDEAVVHLRTALVAQPDLCGAYLKLSEVEEARGASTSSMQALNDFVSRCDQEPLRVAVGDSMLAYAYFRIGMGRLKQGEREQAEEALRICGARFSAQPVAAECAKSLRLLP